MKLSARAWCEVIAAVLIVGGLALGAVNYHRQQMADATATATIKAKQEAEALINQQMATREKQYEAQLASLSQQRKDIASMTPQQIVVRVPQLMPTLPAPITAVTPTSAPPQVGDAIIPQADLKPMAEAAIDAQQCKLDLNKCRQDEGDDQQKLDLVNQQLKASETARKGGTFWNRMKHDGKLIGITAAVGVAAGYAAHHK